MVSFSWDYRYVHQNIKSNYLFRVGISVFLKISCLSFQIMSVITIAFEAKIAIYINVMSAMILDSGKN